MRPKPNEAFEVVQIQDKLEKGLKIVVHLFPQVKEDLASYLKDNVDFFASTTNEMSGIYPEFCLSQDLQYSEAPLGCTMPLQRITRKGRSQDKAINNLVKDNFVTEAKYTT